MVINSRYFNNVNFEQETFESKSNTTVGILQPPYTRTHYFLNKLLIAANRNASRKSGGYRYDDDVRSFASYFRMLAGPLAYDTIQRNLPCALPALSSTNRYLQKSNCKVIGGILRCPELLSYLEKRSLEKVV